MATTPSDDTQVLTSVTPSYRRNGKLFSCEPVCPNATSSDFDMTEHLHSVDAASLDVTITPQYAVVVLVATNLNNASIIQRH